MEWVKFNEQMPEQDKAYLVLTNSGARRVLFWHKPTQENRIQHSWSNVVGWCELPETPESFGDVRLNQNAARLNRKIAFVKSDLNEIRRMQYEIGARIKTTETELEYVLNEMILKKMEDES